ncbi:MAG: cyclic nucleotide-binding domain-containing protein [Spirochaetia bacterium]|nr:cyclic nucleotide-binding domain-containing protein [Spirochaetia bacterium]
MKSKITETDLALTKDFISNNVVLFNGINDNTLTKIASKVSPVSFKAGQDVMKQGEIGDKLYIVVKGKLDVYITDENKSLKKAGEISTGDCVGEGALITKEPRNATVKASIDCELISLSHIDFQEILKESPKEMEAFVRIVGKRSKTINPSQFRPSPEKLRNFLSSIDLMSSLDAETLAALEPKMQWIFLPGGETLMKQDDMGDSMYIVVNGRLRYIVQNQNQEIVDEGEFSRGDIIGEMSLLTGEKRSATVFSTRGCEVVRFTTEVFENLISKNPLGMMNITRTIALRLKNKMGYAKKKRKIKVVTILPLYENLPYTDFAHKLVNCLKKNKSVFYADKKSFVKHLENENNQNISSANISYSLTSLFSWLYTLEDTYELVLIISEPDDKVWTETCIKHTDKIYLLADHQCSESLYPVEIRYLNESSNEKSPEKELILLYDQPDLEPSETGLKLTNRKVSQYHHIRIYEDKDFSRLSRTFMGQSIGLALGGGGAKGFAHIGLLRAFEEEGIPVDIIGGTSAGSIMGALYALGYKINEIESIAKKIMVDKNNLNDYTYPLVSLLRGGKYTHAIREFLGTKKIEDMWIPYFAVATDLTLAEKKVFSEGYLWKAIRASTSLPGIMPPLYDDGSIYVDGALLDNIPGSVLKNKNTGISIAVCLGTGDRKSRDKIFSAIFDERKQGIAPSIIEALKKKLSPRFRKAHVPAMGNLIMRATMVHSLAMEHTTQKSVDLYIELPVGDYSLFGWKDFDKIVEAGYSYAKKNAKTWKTQLGL